MKSRLPIIAIVLSNLLIIGGAYLKIMHYSGSSELLFGGILIGAIGFLSLLLRAKSSKVNS
jgi:hypothetical protein